MMIHNQLPGEQSKGKHAKELQKMKADMDDNN
jgi:hypothetical protein